MSSGHVSAHIYPPVSPCVLRLCHGASKFTRNKYFEYTHQTVDSNNIEISNSENHNHMQIITSFVSVVYMIIFSVCYIIN